MRASWSGMISFGLVNIPIKLYPATRSRDINFNQLHKDDNGRVRYDKVCKVCGNVLGKDDIIKGYEFRKGQYVTITEEELASVDVKSSKTVEITDFVDADQVDALEFERAYYIGPGENGERAYVLLRQALSDQKQMAIGKITISSREKLAGIRLSGNALVLETMYFNNEINKPEGMDIPAADYEISSSELDLAKVLIEHMSAPFEPDRYHDEYEAALKNMIQAKIDGEQVAAPPEPQATNVVDIMAALKASLEAAEKDKKQAEEHRKSA